MRQSSTFLTYGLVIICEGKGSLVSSFFAQKHIAGFICLIELNIFIQLLRSAFCSFAAQKKMPTLQFGILSVSYIFETISNFQLL